MTIAAKQKGGISNGIKLRAEAIRGYYLNPNICLNCNSIIEIKDGQKVSEVKTKKFCNKSCAAILNNKLKPKKTKIINPLSVSNNCEKIKPNEISQNKRKPKGFFIDQKTKIELFNDYLNWQSARSMIQKRARAIFMSSNKQKSCTKCGYNKHYEVCHIKAVSAFSNDTLISEINNIDNLIALCPTHHWEFDNGV